jgi:hypothetical protein
MYKPLLVLLLSISIFGVAQKPAPKPVDVPKYVPNHEQQLELENMLLKAQLTQQQMLSFQNEAQTAKNVLNEQIKQIKDKCKVISKENSWPSTVDCNVEDNLSFSDTKSTEEPLIKRETSNPKN